MRIATAFLVPLVILSAAKPRDPLNPSHLDKLRSKRIQWIKERAPRPQLGIYQDFRAVFTDTAADPVKVAAAAKDSGVQVVFGSAPAEKREGVLFLKKPAEGVSEIYRRESDPRLRSRVKDFPDEALGAGASQQPERIAEWEKKIATQPVTAVASSDAPAGVRLTVAFRNTSTHILARALNENEILDSLAQGRAYIAHDWLCDPAGFFFVAQNAIGGFDIGDLVPAAGEVRFSAYVPVKAKLKLIRGGKMVAESTGSSFSYTAKQPGAYRLEAWLDADGEDFPWIVTNPIYLSGEAPVFRLRRSDGEEPKVYLPRDRNNFPLLVFLDSRGDDTFYRGLGSNFAESGVAVAIAEAADADAAAAAFASAYKKAAELGADPHRVYIGGHSASARIAALLALDPGYLGKQGLDSGAIHGVIAISGTYEGLPVPHLDSPPFLVAYCQWDFPGLARQARELAAGLKRSFVNTQLIYIPAETHVGEIVSAADRESALTQAMLAFLQ